jgi:adenosylcobinamide-GDP ribazoletransferase
MSPRTLLRAGFAAIAFLTRIPVARLATVDAADIARGAWLFPLVGAAVGALTGLVADALVPQLPVLVAGALAVALAALLTGALHLDALADTVDALGGTSRERSLEIMRDEAIGTFGAVALCLVCIVDASALGALATEDEAWLGALVAGALGRAAILPLARILPNARGGAGQGGALERIGWLPVGLGVTVAVLLAVAGGRPGLIAAMVALFTAAALLWFFRRWLGGVTGDALGAAAKVCETAALVAYLATR